MGEGGRAFLKFSIGGRIKDRDGKPLKLCTTSQLFSQQFFSASSSFQQAVLFSKQSSSSFSFCSLCSCSQFSLLVFIYFRSFQFSLLVFISKLISMRGSIGKGILFIETNCSNQTSYLYFGELVHFYNEIIPTQTVFCTCSVNDIDIEEHDTSIETSFFLVRHFLFIHVFVTTKDY
jgi:hypothetical protein